MEAVLEMTEAQQKLEEERTKLMEYKKDKLLEIAQDMSLSTANSDNKTVIVEAILEKTGQLASSVEPVAQVGEELSPAIEPERASEPETESDSISTPAEYLTRLKHLMYTVGEKFSPEEGLVDVQFLDQEIDTWLERGYDVIHFDAVGFTPSGHRLLWVMEKTDKPKYTQTKHIVRTLTNMPNEVSKTITGFQADAYISYMIETDGWELVSVRYNGNDNDGAGMFMIWMLAK